ncbi:MAG: hypothetical protein ACI88H_001938 [Cocleimonas sp.]|jgi:uncharacterized protein (DUF58 family)
MNIFSRWFKVKERQSSSEVIVNSATHVTTKELILLQQQAHKLDMSHRSYARSTSTGSHHSQFRGRGMDYQESRIYQAGDDIRNMDWRVTARAGKPHTKLYQEERERPVVLVVDFNPGMFFGSTKSLKSVLAAKAATLIAWSVAARGDRIGALIINDSHHELAPKTGKRGVLQLIRELVLHSNPTLALGLGIDQKTSGSQSEKSSHIRMNDELKRLRRLAKPGSLIFIISDFYDVDEETAEHLKQISRHNDIQAIQIVDPLEIAPPPPDRYAVTDGKSSGVVNTKSREGYDKYQQFFSLHHQKVEDLMRKQKIPLLQLSTQDDVLLALQRSFGNRKQRAPISGGGIINKSKNNIAPSKAAKVV